MLTDRKKPTARAAGGTSAGASAVVRRNEAKEARRLFENRLVQVSLRMPKSMTQMAEVEFEMPMQDLMANVIVTGGALAEVLKSQDGSMNGAVSQRPTPRLRRAMASAGKVKRGRYADTDEMFDALDKATRG